MSYNDNDINKLSKAEKGIIIISLIILTVVMLYNGVM